MNRPITAAVAVLLLTTPPAAAQMETAETILRTAVQAMDTDTLRCVTYSGTDGYIGLVGQNFHPAEDWARVALASYSRTINYDRHHARGAGAAAGRPPRPDTDARAPGRRPPARRGA